MKYTGYIYIIENIINNLKYACEKIRQALLNRDKEIIHRISLKLKGRKLDKQSIIRFKPVLQYDLNGNFIKECHSRNRKIAQYDINNNLINIYTSKSEILNTLKIKKSALKMCLCGKNKTSGGFIWKYIIERRKFNEKL